MTASRYGDWRWTGRYKW